MSTWTCEAAWPAVASDRVTVCDDFSIDIVPLAMKKPATSSVTPPEARSILPRKPSCVSDKLLPVPVTSDTACACSTPSTVRAAKSITLLSATPSA